MTTKQPQKRLVPRRQLEIHSNAGRYKPPEPPKPLVCKGKYVRFLGQMVSLTLLSMVSFVAGIVLCLAAFLELMGFIFYLPIWEMACCVLVSSGLSVVFLWLGRKLSHEVSAVEHVQPLTLHNAHLLPPEDILLRGSDISATDLSAELLRAVRPGPDTPPEELLRATGENSPHV